MELKLELKVMAGQRNRHLRAKQTTTLSPGNNLPSLCVHDQSARQHCSIHDGFTLIELLVVVAIIAIILGFTVPAVIGLSKSNNLNTAGRIVSNVLTVARSEAINRRTLIRFEIATDWPADPAFAYRKFTVVQHDVQTASDTQLTGWETLPAGTIFQPQDPLGGNAKTTDGKYFFILNQMQKPALTIAG